MKKHFKLKVAMIVLAAVIVAGAVAYQPLVNYLSEQAANPQGVVGKIMTWIWSGYFKGLNEWGLTLIDIQDYDSILDVGFGGGSNIDLMASENEHCVIQGVDISEEAVTTATDINRKWIDEGRVILHLGGVADLKFEPGTFDLVVASQTHMYWDELEAGLRECHRVLEPGGTFFINSELDVLAHHLPAYSAAADFTALLTEIGFSDVTVSERENYIAFIAVK